MKRHILYFYNALLPHMQQMLLQLINVMNVTVTSYLHHI